MFNFLLTIISYCVVIVLYTEYIIHARYIDYLLGFFFLITIIITVIFLYGPEYNAIFASVIKIKHRRCLCIFMQTM